MRIIRVNHIACLLPLFLAARFFAAGVCAQRPSPGTADGAGEGLCLVGYENAGADDIVKLNLAVIAGKTRLEPVRQ
ncbi:MAG: hypothetical protein KKH28_02930 [Elusimicrobia bacterium]|nr:hypothetical protein [Elusimicrobiota bacterium]